MVVFHQLGGARTHEKSVNCEPARLLFIKVQGGTGSILRLWLQWRQNTQIQSPLLILRTLT